MNKKRRFRFVIDIDGETHKVVKMRAHLRNITMRDYILQALAQRIAREERCDIKDDLYEH